jgi:hypothetical protein
MKIGQMKIKLKVKGIFFACVANDGWWYWLYNNKDYAPWHLTLDGRNANAKFERFHLTIDPGGGHTVGVRYYVNCGARTVVYDGFINNSFPQAWLAANRARIGNLLDANNSYHQAALEFCNKQIDQVHEPICTAVSIAHEARNL